MANIPTTIFSILMPTYSYICNDCNVEFELFAYIKDYTPNPRCSKCNKTNTIRQYIKDVQTQNTSIRKSDDQLKTIGDLAQRHADRMSDDEKLSLYNKHNAYKESGEVQNLPSGMSRVKKPPKTKWPGSVKKIKRKPNR
jgi:putative FmdB family regulatory protein